MKLRFTRPKRRYEKRAEQLGAYVTILREGGEEVLQTLLRKRMPELDARVYMTVVKYEAVKGERE